jgi:sulfur-oxidizing protein SoxX
MRSTVLLAMTTLGLAAATIAVAEPGRFINERQLQRALRQAFPSQPEAWLERLIPDQTMATCTHWQNQPPKEIADKIKQHEAGRIRLPPDGQFMGDWRRGETVAHSGYGLRFTDTDGRRQNGGNCYACHELSPDEVSFGTLGVSLKGYGRINKYSPAVARTAYEKIFDSQAIVACSAMPRFGANDILTIDQIKDLVAYLMHPDSPVNKEPAATAGSQAGSRAPAGPAAPPRK